MNEMTMQEMTPDEVESVAGASSKPCASIAFTRVSITRLDTHHQPTDPVSVQFTRVGIAFINRGKT